VVRSYKLLVEIPHINSDIPSPQPVPNPAREQWINDVKIEDEKIKQYEKQIQTIEKELGIIEWTYVDNISEESPFKATELADTLRHRVEYNIVTDKNTQVIYLYTNTTGVYHKDGEQYLRFLIDRILGSESTIHRINETIELLKIRSYSTIIHSQKIAVENGLLDIQTGKLVPFTPYEFNTAKLKVSYKEDAKSEPWLKFINEVCPDDKDLLQEWSGYLLIKGYPYHAIMWFYGPKGRNGKGVWARTMQSILGEENYSAEPLEKLDGVHKFSVFNLHDSLLNICNEPKADRNLTVEQLQALTGQDTLDAERKGVQEPFKLKNGAKITVMGNKFPTVKTPTDAFWERLKLIKFPFRFVGTDQVPDIEKTWLEDPEQRSGILNWMIEGALRLINNMGRFTETKTQQETIIQFKRASDNVSSFIAECIELNQKETTPKSNVQEHYKLYCEVIGSPAQSPTKLNDGLETLSSVKESSIREGIGKDKHKVKVWKGLKLKPLPEEIDNSEEEEDDSQVTLDKLNSKVNVEPVEPVEPVLHDFPSLSKHEENKNNSGNTLKSVPSVPSVPLSNNLKSNEVVNDKILHFHKLGPHELHKCNACNDVLAEFQQDKYFFCRSCFLLAERKAVADGVQLVEDRQDQVDAPDFEGKEV
jgi:P4 family phage/plasmid primase-like protien